MSWAELWASFCGLRWRFDPLLLFLSSSLSSRLPLLLSLDSFVALRAVFPFLLMLLFHLLSSILFCSADLTPKNQKKPKKTTKHKPLQKITGISLKTSRLLFPILYHYTIFFLELEFDIVVQLPLCCTIIAPSLSESDSFPSTKLFRACWGRFLRSESAGCLYRAMNWTARSAVQDAVM